MNTKHDSKGRFASGGGGVTGTRKRNTSKSAIKALSERRTMDTFSRLIAKNSRGGVLKLR